MLKRLFVSGSIRQIIANLLLLVLVPVLLVQLLVFIFLLKARFADAEGDNLDVARTVALGFNEYVQDVLREERTLGNVIAAPGVNNTAISRLLAINASEFPAIDDFYWTTPQGRIIAAGNPKAVGVDLGDLAYLRQISAGQEWVVSNLLTSRVSGEPAFNIVRGIRNAQGTLQGILIGAVDPNRLDETFAVQRTGNSAIVFVDAQGLIVYRYPEIQLTMAQRHQTQDRPFIAQALQGKEAVSTYRSSIDNQRWLGAAAPVPTIGWATVASRAQSDVLAPIYREFLQELALLLMISSITLTIALAISGRITTPLKHLQEQTQLVARGELAQHLEENGPAEVRSLSIAFNRMADDLRRREEERNAYIHTISHDLRVPLTIVMGHGELLTEYLAERGLDAELAESVEAIRQSGQRMNLMIQDMVDSARIEAGQLHLQLQPVALQLYIPNLLVRAKTMLATARITTDIPVDLPFVNADPDRLERMLMNLLTNAQKYSPPGSPIIIRATPTDHLVEIAVTDAGIGIAPADLPHLFERFFRTQGTRKTEGLGLGLYITRLLVTAHGGQIRVDSQPGKGSTFAFTLPTVGE